MELSSELEMFRGTARRTLAGYPEITGVLRKLAIDETASVTAIKVASDQGWLSVFADEALGGLDMGTAAGVVLAKEIGRALMPGPIMAAAMLLPPLARQVPAFRQLAQEALHGNARVSIAVPMARREGAQEYIADHVAGSTDIIAVEQDAGCQTFRWFKTENLLERLPFDPTCPVAELRITSTDTRPALADAALLPSDAAELLGPIHLWIAAELLGVAERAGELSVTHAKERKQFDQFIGAFQGVKHRIVDDYVLRETAEAIIGVAAERWDQNTEDKVLMAHAARYAASQAALSSTAHCIQVHGGLGISWEHTAHLYYKRARRLDALLGSAGDSLTAIAAALVDRDA